MAGRPCTICSSGERLRVCAAMIAEGASDQAIADRIGASRDAVRRHRHAHVLAPAQLAVERAAKGSQVRRQREETIAAVEDNAALAFVTAAAITRDLQAAVQRLERMARQAEEDAQPSTVASLAGQQIRASEVRAKIGGVGGYGAAKGASTRYR